MVFIPLLAVMMLINLGVLAAGVANKPTLAIHLAHSAILVFGILVSLVGGRVIPFFTRSATAQNTSPANIESTPRLDLWLAGLSIAGAVLFFISAFFTPPISPAWLMLLAGSLHLLRLTYWQSSKSHSQPLLWSLHVSYGCLGLGLILLGLSEFLSAISFSSALHIIALGTIGAMILSMMARVSLGHTGRSPNNDPISNSPALTTALASLFIATAIRFIFRLLGMSLEAWNISGLLWIVSFSLFIKHYLPILTQEKQIPQPLAKP